MSECLDRLPSATAGVSVFDRLVAFDVYDGPLAGIAFCAGSNDAVFFRLEAWDERQEVRVFSVSPMLTDEATAVVKDLTSVDTPRWPEWWLNPDASDDARRKIEEAVARTKRQAGPVTWIVRTRDLLNGFANAARLTDDGARYRCEALRRRASPDAEVSDGSFADWVKFIEDYSAAQ